MFTLIQKHLREINRDAIGIDENVKVFTSLRHICLNSNNPCEVLISRVPKILVALL